LGYRILHDRVNIDKEIRKFIKKIAEQKQNYILIKRKKRNLTAIAKAVIEHKAKN